MNKYRSKYEVSIAKGLTDLNIKFEYETVKLKFYLSKKGRCSGCHGTDVAIVRNYTPDFVFLDGKIIIEAKGLFTPSDRTKMAQVVMQHRDLDIRMLFMRDQWCTRNKRQRYSDWCNAHHIKYAFGSSPPEEWIKEITNG
jgi:hypothetical protein|tara:strand:- start:124 stop:543 length:420 start_codon:yes stop_codon:yes gene_type:complete